jgi:chromosome segregation ATPase
MNEGDLLERLSEIQHTFSTIKQTKMLDYNISAAKFSLDQLRVEESQLVRRLDKLKGRLARLQSDRCIPEDENDAPDLVVPESGGFFNQLRSYEAVLEKLASRKDGLSSQVRHLKDAVSETLAKQKRLHREVSRLQTQLPEVEARTQSLASVCQEKTFELSELDTVMIGLKEDCEVIRDSIRSKVEEMRQFTPEQTSLLLTQKSALETAVKKARDQLGPLKIQAAQTLSANKVSQKDRERKLKQLESPIQWMSERTALLGRIKRARGELAQMKNRERGVARAVENLRHRTISEAEIKSSLIAEAGSFPQSLSQFYADTMETEVEYQQELTHELKEIDQALEHAQVNSRSVLELLARQESIEIQNDRIDALKAELEDLRAKLV